uniref:PiggyBac transposable element-derived protein domain-containing protein n=1 Tax=Octopus bimaculoides TaxID=37653 RepID=A0A0L8HE04_OCTBM
MHAFDLYTGKRDSPNKTENAFGLGGNIVLDLIDVVGVPGNTGFKIFFDNYFTSIQLMEKLFEKGICASGTCRENRTARCPFKMKTEMKACPRGTADFKSTSNTVTVKWKDNNGVVLLSNFETYKMSTVECYDRPQKKYVPIPQPEIIQNYNKYMGFVYLLDHNIASYRIRMLQNKWWWPILSYFVSVATQNACILMNRARHKITLYN